MDSSNLAIELLGEKDIDSAITCIQQAFADDPYSNWVFDKRVFSKERNHASLRTRCIWGMKYAQFYVAKNADAAEGTSNVLGVAMWQPPSIARPSPRSTWRQYLMSFVSPSAWSDWTSNQASAWSLWGAQLQTNLRHGRGGLIVRRYWIWKDAQAEAQQSLWQDPDGYYFCNIITVSPDAQGKGVGRALMDVVLKRADAEGRRCYLESSRDVPNVSIYERMGFMVVRTMQCQDGEKDKGVKLFCMMREPER
ncbi:MAG: hypothetical protein Q9162_005185 [Coniocarpon cinnabarinum]